MLYTRSSSFSPMSPLRSFRVLHFIFISTIHFKLIFVKSTGCLFFHVDAQFSSTIYWKYHLCFIVLLLLLCQRPVYFFYYMLVYFWALCSVSLMCFLHFHQYHSVLIIETLCKSWRKSVSPSTLFFSFNFVLAIQVVFPLHINFIIS